MPLYLTTLGNAGTVTSVGLSVPAVLYTVSNSPVTGAGTLTETLQTQTANTVFSGPGSGGAVAPTFRALVAADVPTTLGGTAFSVSTGNSVTATRADAGTTTTPSAIQVLHTTSATPAAGFGAGIQILAHDSTNTLQTLSTTIASWVVATSASRTSRITHYVSDFNNGLRECLRLEATGTAAALSFYGAAAVVKPTVTGAKGSNAALGSLMTALSNLGLVTDSTTA